MNFCWRWNLVKTNWKLPGFDGNVLSCFGTETLFSGKKWKLVPSEFKYPEFGGNLHLRCFGWEIPFIGKFGPKVAELLFEGRNWCLDWFKFSEFACDVRLVCILTENTFFWVNFVQKILTVCLRSNKVHTQTNWNTSNFIIMFTAPGWDRSPLFEKIWRKKSKLPAYNGRWYL